MITDIRVVSAPDLSVNNKVIDLGSMHLPKGKTLAGACWSVVGFPAYESLFSVLIFVFDLTKKKFPDYKIRLLVGNSEWQPDTRIVRYYKLWRGLAMRGIEISNACSTQEIMHEAEGKLRFFGAAQLSPPSVESVVKVLLKERCTYLVVLPKHVELDGILNIGWSGDLAFDSNVIVSIIDNDGFIMKQIGEFDDNERGMIVVGQPKLIELLLK